MSFRSVAIGVLAGATLAFPSSGMAGELLAGFQKALSVDPTYQSAKAELEVNRISAERASRAYWPEFGVKAGERTEIQGFQTVFQVAQPLVDADRYATTKGAEPMDVRATATMRTREADLLQRYVSAVADLVRARESLIQNESKTAALAKQVDAAKSGLGLGTGTIMDIYDAEVRLALSRAEAFSLRAALEAAERQYRSQTGEMPGTQGFNLARQQRSIPLRSLEALFDQAEKLNPAVIAALQSERLADLDVTRKYGAFLPRINAIARQTRVQDGQSSQYFGFAFELPLQSGSFLDVSGAKAALVKATEDVRAARVKTRLEIERLYALVVNGRMELPIRLEAMQAAQSSVKANTESFQRGVRSQIDVLNSIQTQFQTQVDYVGSM